MGKEMIQFFDGEKGYFDQMGTKWIFLQIRSAK
jgi:hypothetical protein